MLSPRVGQAFVRNDERSDAWVVDPSQRSQMKPRSPRS